MLRHASIALLAAALASACVPTPVLPNDCPPEGCGEEPPAVDPCTPNPCAGSHQTTCVPNGSVAVCTCDPGYAPEGSGCAAEAVYDCAEGGSGPYEPNPCPAKATLLQAGPPQPHAIDAAGDADWLEIKVEAGKVYRVTLNAEPSLPLYVDLYPEGSAVPIAYDHRGVSSLTLGTKAPATGSLFVRVRAFSGSETGSYAISTQGPLRDDYPDVPASASPVDSSSTMLPGGLDFFGDADVHRVALEAGRSYDFQVQFEGLAGPVTAELVDAQGAVLRTATSPAPRITTRPSEAQTAFLVIRGSTPYAAGAYTWSFTDRGPDDHGDTALEADPLVSPVFGAAPTPDRDAFWFDAQAGHAYQVSCQGLGSPSGCTVTLLDASGNVIGSADRYSSPAQFTRVLSAGRYSVIVGDSSAYRLTLDDLGVDEASEVVFGAPELVLGESRTGALQTSADLDVYAFRADTTPTLYRVHVESPSLILGVRRSDTGVLIRSSISGAGDLTFKGADGATYGIELGRDTYSYAIPGPYLVRIDAVGFDDAPDAWSQAAPVAVPSGPTPGVLELGTDVDAFSFAGQAGHLYRIPCARVSLQSCSLRVRSPSGTQVASADSYSGEASVVVELTSSGTWSYEIASYTYSSPGSYTHAISDIGLDDHGDGPSTSTAISLGALWDGKLERVGDIDAFGFDAIPGHVYRVTTISSELSSRALKLKTVDGLELASTSTYSSLSDSVLPYEAKVTGRLYVELSGGSGGSIGGTGAYQVRVEDLGIEDHGDTPATATALDAVPATHSGRLDAPGDVDVFSFPVLAGHAYQSSCDPGSVAGCLTELRLASGVVVGHGTVAQGAAYRPSADGTLYVAVYGQQAGTFGDYGVSLNDVGLDDVPNGAEGAPALPGGGSASGQLDAENDVDVFSFTPAVGRSYRVGCAPSSPLTGCSLRVRTSTSALVGQQDGSSPFVAFEVGAPETFTIEVSPYGYTRGPYVVSVVDLGVDEYGDTRATATALGTGRTIVGALQYSKDEDWVSLELTEAKDYSVSGPYNNAMRFEAYGPTGAMVGSGYGGGFSFSANVTGTYFLRLWTGYATDTIGYQYSVQ